MQHPDFADNIHSLKRIIMDSQQQDSEELKLKLRQTDLYRNQNFAKSHPKIAKAIGYEL